MIRIILAAGILVLITLITVTIFVRSSSNSAQDVEPVETGVVFPDSTDVDVTPVVEPAPQEVIVYEEAPKEYQVKELPTSGIVTSLITNDPSPLFANVLSEVFLDVYWKLECELPDGSTERAVIMTAKPSVEEGGGDIDMARFAIRNWEPNIARDLGNTLFPSERRGFDTVNLEFTNYDRNSRFATFSLNQGNYEVHYGWVLNFAIFTTSHACLLAVIEDTYAPHGH